MSNNIKQLQTTPNFVNLIDNINLLTSKKSLFPAGSFLLFL